MGENLSNETVMRRDKSVETGKNNRIKSTVGSMKNGLKK